VPQARDACKDAWEAKDKGGSFALPPLIFIPLSFRGSPQG
jgi:hypothetical protein